YVKNVMLGEPSKYETTITCKLEYTNPPVQSGDYYINEMTWNTYVDSEEFLGLLESSMPFAAMDVTLDMWAGGAAEAISASVASDIHVPSFQVSTTSAEKTDTLSKVLQQVLTGPFAESVPEIASIRVIDVSGPKLVHPDVRPLRAVILSALLSCFFVVVLLLMRELGADSIWLPATLRRRYGLPALGTIHSLELQENACYLFKNKERIAVCAVEESVNPQEVLKFMQEKIQKEWFAVPTPALSPETAEVLREADGVLLVVESGLHAGKPLEYVLEFMVVQEILVTAAILWNADEALIKAYYFGRK
ncbi:MAG: hypothetical protein NC092_02115, partial [Butyrivibrio sp.]|nr:hypothetical protein [Butyrivibrio sp.]